MVQSMEFHTEKRNGKEYENEDISGECTMISMLKSRWVSLPFKNKEMMEKGVKFSLKPPQQITEWHAG